MERKDLESAAAQLTYLRGLLVVPLGLLFVVTGLGNLRWGPFRHAVVFVAAVVLLAAAYVLTKRYYDRHYGVATPSRRRQVRDTAVNAVLSGAGLVGGVVLDSTFDLPVSLFTIAFALAMLGWFALTLGLRAHQVAVWGALLVVGLLPVWGGLADKVSVAWLPIGAATVVAGVLDHRALVRTFGPADLTDVGA